MLRNYTLLILVILTITTQVVLSAQLEQPISVNERPNPSISKNMLNENEKERIRLEEIYRDEVRQSLKEKKEQSIWKSVISFLNTGLGLWLLSFFIVTIGGKIITRWIARLKEQTETRTLIRKLDTEISYRLDSIRKYLDEEDVGRRMTQGWFIDYLDTTSSSIPSISLEFKDRGLKSLIGELAHVVPKGSERQELISVMKSLNALGLKAEKREALVNSEFIRSVIKDYESHIIIERWKLK